MQNISQVTDHTMNNQLESIYIEVLYKTYAALSKHLSTEFIHVQEILVGILDKKLLHGLTKLLHLPISRALGANLQVALSVLTAYKV